MIMERYKIVLQVGALVLILGLILYLMNIPMIGLLVASLGALAMLMSVLMKGSDSSSKEGLRPEDISAPMAKETRACDGCQRDIPFESRFYPNCGHKIHRFGKDQDL